jgi:outer membrane cobalamin receptor
MAPNLKPERARQVNLGITQADTWSVFGLQGSIQLTLDGYYNRVNDKIMSYPSHSMYYWTTANLGRVDILGVDVTADLNLSPFTFHLNYTYQHAVDHSQEGSKTYGHQLVYTPRHSGGGSARWESRWVNLGLTAMVVGDRYYMQQNDDKYRLPAYCDLGLSADRSFDLRIGTLSFRAALLNLLNVQYEVVRSYPMMGRNWRLGIVYEF